jgi:hypothetical protein
MDEIAKLYLLKKIVEKPTYISITTTQDPSYLPASGIQVHEIRELLVEIKQKLEAEVPKSTPVLLNPVGKPIKLTSLLPEPKGESEVDDNLRSKFAHLTKQWKDETQFASTMIEIALHPAYQQIIGMGPAAISLILQRLKTEPDHWFWALKAITGEDPVPESSRGRLKEMTEAWLNWGRRQGHEC